MFGLGGDKLHNAVDDGSTKPSTGMLAHAKRLDLPADLSAYNKQPWRCVRDAVAQAHFKAEAVQILKFGHQVHQLCLWVSGKLIILPARKCAPCPRAAPWTSIALRRRLRRALSRGGQTAFFSHATVFFIWTSCDQKGKAGVKYHLKRVTLRSCASRLACARSEAAWPERALNGE